MTDHQFFIERPYQKEAADAVFDYLEEHDWKKNPVVVLPTGTGKTIVLAGVCDRILTKKPTSNILVLSHSAEIVDQDYEALAFHFGDGIGVFSSGLGYKEIEKITVAGIQSVNRNRDKFADFDVVIVDEAHAVNPKQTGMYRQLFDEMTRDPVVIGLTATPFRLGTGYIHDGDDAIFDAIVCDYSSGKKFRSLVTDGYLCPLIGKRTNYEMDTTGVKITAGDFNNKQLSTKLNREEITRIAVEEVIKYGKNYKKWLFFAIDIDHAENITRMLRNRGIDAGCVHSRMEEKRDPIVQDFKDGKLRALVNVNVLTTGFNVPDIDLIAMMRPTSSPVIHVQTLGRGTRPFPGKTHCFVMDFGGNIKRLGTIDDITVKKKGKKKGGGACVKECKNCAALNHIRAKECVACGAPFKIKERLTTSAHQGDAIRNDDQPIKKYRVTRESYKRHQKAGVPDSIKVTFFCGIKLFTMYVCLDHSGYARAKARMFVKRRFANPPDTVDEFLDRVSECRKTDVIQVDTSQKYPEILNTYISPEQSEISGL